ncbi:MAG: transglutaminase-like domain-containing protein [Gammaproteobacteria bacterium]|nr:transglutaminase-like domain-containing protein [Gammaproteobacteria bacterium]
MRDLSGQDAPPAEGFRLLRERGGRVVDAALLVSAVVDPATDADWCRSELRRLADAAPPEAGPEELVEALRAAGFAGARRTYYEARNSALDYVLRERRGIPISLAVVVIGTAECLGLEASGLNFPRHFLVDVEGLLVDPFQMRVTTRDEWRDWLRREARTAQGRLSEADLDAAFRPAGPADMALRMLNNLRMLREVRGDPDYALRLTDCQLALQPDAYALHVDRADIWLALRSLDMARRELETALDLADGEAKDSIRTRLSALPDEPGVAN